MHRTRVATLILALAAGAAALPLAAQSGPPAPPGAPGAVPAVADSGRFSLQVPRVVGEFTGMSRRNYPDPSLGSLFRFRTADSLHVDVYIYPAPGERHGCGAACVDSAARVQSVSFTNGIPEYLRRGYFTAATVVADSGLVPGAGAAWRTGRMVRLDVEQDGVGQRSDFFLYALPDFWVKLRATYAADEDPERIARFGAALLEVLAGTRTAVPPG